MIPEPMDIDRCNSIFELFSAFNFAYAILSLPNGTTRTVSSPASEEPDEDKSSKKFDPKSFVDMVDYNLIKPLSILYEKIDMNIGEIMMQQNSVVTLKEIETLKGNSSKANNCDTFYKSLEQQADILRNVRDAAEEEKVSSKEAINGKFPLISFLLGLFCITVLILSVSQSPHKHLTLLCVDISVIICYFIIFGLIKRKNAYLWVVLPYSFLIGACIYLHFWLPTLGDLEYPAFLKRYLQIENSSARKQKLIFFTVVLPFSHFLIYFIIFSLKTLITYFKYLPVLWMVEKQLKKLDLQISNLRI